jgi:hypothetical protein
MCGGGAPHPSADRFSLDSRPQLSPAFGVKANGLMWNFRTNRIQRGTLLAALILAVLCLVMVLSLRLAEARRPEIILYPPGYQMPRNQGPLLERLIPRNWNWAWKLRDKLLGKMRTVFIQGSCFALTSPSESAFNGLNAGTPTYRSNDGTVVWLLPNMKPDALAATLRKTGIATELFTGRMTSADQMMAQLSSGNKLVTFDGIADVGFVMQTFPRLRKGKIDLQSMFTSTEAITNVAELPGQPSRYRISVRTNASFATRIQVPAGGLALIVTPDRGSQTNRQIALLLAAKEE